MTPVPGITSGFWVIRTGRGLKLLLKLQQPSKTVSVLLLRFLFTQDRLQIKTSGFVLLGGFLTLELPKPKLLVYKIGGRTNPSDILGSVKKGSHLY